MRSSGSRSAGAALLGGLLALVTARSFDASILMTARPTVLAAGGAGAAALLPWRGPRRAGLTASLPAGSGQVGGQDSSVRRLDRAVGELRSQVVRADAAPPPASASSWQDVLADIAALRQVWELRPPRSRSASTPWPW